MARISILTCICLVEIARVSILTCICLVEMARSSLNAYFEFDRQVMNGGSFAYRSSRKKYEYEQKKSMELENMGEESGN